MAEAGVLPNTALVGYPTRLATLTWWLAWGTGTTADSTADTVVESEITTGGIVRTAGTAAYEASYKLVVTASATATATKTVTKVGMFDAASGGNLYAVRKFSSSHTILAGNAIISTVRTTFGRGA